jgi:hypothetical protein
LFFDPFGLPAILFLRKKKKWQATTTRTNNTVSQRVFAKKHAAIS